MTATHSLITGMYVYTTSNEDLAQVIAVDPLTGLINIVIRLVCDYAGRSEDAPKPGDEWQVPADAFEIGGRYDVMYVFLERGVKVSP